MEGMDMMHNMEFGHHDEDELGDFVDDDFGQDEDIDDLLEGM